MAKSNVVLIKLMSTEGTGFYYVTKKNARKNTDKMQMRKYDPILRRHVMFKEEKIK
jgi:large subunit ribosomal protein L33